MQRAAAIIGPTPAFVRWAINRPCELREIDEERLPDTTFRQLRSIQELDLALREQRVFQGVAFHVNTQRGQELVGFLPSEILDASGGESMVEDACTNCAANTQSDNGGWVGCFGIAKLEHSDLIGIFESVLERLGLAAEFTRSFVPTSPHWYGVWLVDAWRGVQIDLLLKVFETLDLDSEWEQLREAMRRCQLNGLELHAEYFPSGNSDGQRWKWDEHCDRCRALVDHEKETACKCCGRKLVKQAVKKRKVLGLRPYMKLKHVLGEQKCEQLVNEYLEWKVRTES